MIDLVRCDLGGLIVGRICPPAARLPVITLDSTLETAIVQGLHDPLTGQPVIEPDLARGIGERIAAIIAERGEGAGLPALPALVVQPQARRALHALLRLRAPGCLVISISELPPAQPIEVIAVIGRDAPPATPALPSPPIVEPASFGALAA